MIVRVSDHSGLCTELIAKAAFILSESYSLPAARPPAKPPALSGVGGGRGPGALGSRFAGLGRGGTMNGKHLIFRLKFRPNFRLNYLRILGLGFRV